jgi:hypothetical protein
VLVDEFLPGFDVSDEIQTTVAADVATTWRTLIEADLIDVGKRRPLVAVLGAVRILPEIVWQLLHGERPSGAPDRLTLLDTTKLPMSGGGWVLLGQRPEEEIALGLVGKFWRPVIEYAQVDAATFKEFSEPGFAKTIYALGTLRARDAPDRGGQDAPVGDHAHCEHRRARPHLVSPLLDLRGRLRRTRARSRAARRRPRGRRTSERNLTGAPEPGHTRQRRERSSRMSKAPTAIRTHWLAASELRPPPSSRAAKKLSY